MLNLVITWLFSAALLFITSRVIDGFQMPDFTTAMIASLVIGLLNIVIRPLLNFLAVPINLVTLGLFTFVINAVILKLADALMNSFNITGWGPAILAAIFLAVIQIIANFFLPGERKFLGRN